MKNNMNINKHNYEAYFLDYHEGSLSLDLVKELMDFISQHPELREEFESFEPITLNDIEGIKYDGKQGLKKEAGGINPSNFDEYAVEYVEGTISAARQKELNAFIRKNVQYQQELDLYAKTKLAPDLAIVFEDKLSLKKGAKRPVLWYYWSAAASVALIIGTYFMLHKSETPRENNMARNAVVEDSNQIVNHTTKAIDMANVIKKNAPVLTIHRIASTPAIVKVQQDRNCETILKKSDADSSTIVVNKGKNENTIAPVKKQMPLPTPPMNAPVASNANVPDTASVSQPLIIVKNPQPEVAAVETTRRKKRGKLLVFLATVTCKELHKVTGQHIELEKQYSSDTTAIVAYQLDLGNKKFNFPVKE